jgi:hypothetical protein
MTITEKKKDSIREICKEYFSIDGFEKELNELFESVSKKPEDLNPESIQKELNDVLSLIKDDLTKQKLKNKIQGALLKDEINIDQIQEISFSEAGKTK